MKKIKVFLIFTVLLVIAEIFIRFIKLGGESYLMFFSDLMPVVCSLLAVIGLFYAYSSLKEFDFVKKSWLLILIGIVSYTIAEAVYLVLECCLGYDMNEIFPSLADIFWCFGYIPLLAGMLMMFMGYYKSGFPMGNMKLWGVLSLLLLIIAAFVIVYILIPIVKDPESSKLTTFFSLFYPIADVVIVIPAIILMYITSLFGSGSVSKPWRFLALGFVLFTFADLMYSYLVWQGTYESGGLTDMAWDIGYIFIAFSGIYQYQLVKSIKEGK